MEPKSSREASRHTSSKPFHRILLFGIILVFVVFSQLENQSHLGSIWPILYSWSGNDSFATKRIATATAAPSFFTCAFRNISRYYGLTEDSYPPAFLRSAFYIHGEPPFVLPLSSSSITKICFKPSPLHLQVKIQNLTTGQGDTLTLTQPLMDGTNPTLVSLHRLQTELQSSSLDAFSLLWQNFPTAAYFVSSTHKAVSQCNYDLAQKKKDQRKRKEYVITENHPPGRQYRNEVDLMLVDVQYRTLWQTTILSSTPPNKLSADDARLLVHNGDLFLTFKRYGDDGGNGSVLYLAKLKGIVVQDLNDDREGNLDPSFQVHAVNEWAMCCGRNFMALSSRRFPYSSDEKNRTTSSRQISFLTWPDPIWVQSFDTTTRPWNESTRTDSSPNNIISIGLKNPTVASTNAMGKTSKFHGTSGFLLYLPDTEEYLGLGHIHRERKWAKNFRMDAKFGHHYTHAFFTITSEAPYQLKRLSPEFLFPSSTNPYDADIIQFASGLEWAAPQPQDHVVPRKIIIAYGINDCEGAVVHVDWATIDGLLRPVPKGSQVVDTMANITREDFLSHAILKPT